MCNNHSITSTGQRHTKIRAVTANTISVHHFPSLNKLTMLTDISSTLTEHVYSERSFPELQPHPELWQMRGSKVHGLSVAIYVKRSGELTSIEKI